MDVFIDIFRLVTLETDVPAGVRHPGVLEDGLQRYPVLGPDPQAGQDQLLAVAGEAGHAEPHIRGADVLVLLEGDVAADHVVQEDAQAPHCQLVSVVTFLDNPLRGRVDSRACTQHFVPKQNNSANNLPS